MPVQHDGHQQGGRLVVGPGPVGHAGDEPLQGGAIQLAAIPFGANEIDGAHGMAKSIIHGAVSLRPMADAPTLSPEKSLARDVDPLKCM